MVKVANDTSNQVGLRRTASQSPLIPPGPRGPLPSADEEGRSFGVPGRVPGSPDSDLPAPPRSSLLGARVPDPASSVMFISSLARAPCSVQSYVAANELIRRMAPCLLFLGRAGMSGSAQEARPPAGGMNCGRRAAVSSPCLDPSGLPRPEPSRDRSRRGPAPARRPPSRSHWRTPAHPRSRHAPPCGW